MILGIIISLNWSIVSGSFFFLLGLIFWFNIIINCLLTLWKNCLVSCLTYSYFLFLVLILLLIEWESIIYGNSYIFFNNLLYLTINVSYFFWNLRIIGCCYSIIIVRWLFLFLWCLISFNDSVLNRNYCLIWCDYSVIVILYIV